MRTKFLIADEVKPEPNGKQSVRGLFPDDTIILSFPPNYTETPGTPPPGMDLLTCMLSVAGLAPGKHKIKGQLLDPLGKLNAETPAVDFEVAKGNSHTFPFTLQPFIVSGGAGAYTWTFRVDERECTHAFSVRLLKSDGSDAE